MRRKNILILLAVAAGIAAMFYSFQGSQDDTAYVSQIEKDRSERERFLKTSKESPFADNPEQFQGLRFYPPDIRYRIVARLEPIKDRNVVLLQTNDGKTQRYIEYAWASFKFDGIENRLLILEVADMGPFRGQLFLAFGDATSADETYGAGRYLDLTKTPGASNITLDFNRAYNPYCAYDESFSCPLPPADNLLAIPIRAGEKNYQSEQAH